MWFSSKFDSDFSDLPLWLHVIFLSVLLSIHGSSGCYFFLLKLQYASIGAIFDYCGRDPYKPLWWSFIAQSRSFIGGDDNGDLATGSCFSGQISVWVLTESRVLYRLHCFVLFFFLYLNPSFISLLSISGSRAFCLIQRYLPINFKKKIKKIKGKGGGRGFPVAIGWGKQISMCS